MSNKQDLKDVWPIINEVVSSDGEFSLKPNGVSMLPLIRPGIDAVTIVAPKDLKKDDIVLYRRASGQFVLHRLIRIKKGRCTMFGDNQKIIEYKIPVTNVLAKVKSIYRDGEAIDFDGKEYKKYLKKLHRKINFYKLPTLLYRIKCKLVKRKSTSK